MLCPNCGREVQSLHEGFCADCASQRLALVEIPSVIDATLCAHCGRMHSGASWIRVAGDGSHRVQAVVQAALRLDPRLSDLSTSFTDRFEDERNAVVGVSVEAALDGARVQRASEVRVRFKNGACPDCSREVGGYFEAILQVRGSQGTDIQRHLERIEDTLLRRLDQYKDEGRPNSFVAKIDRMRHGHDYYLGSKEAARLLTKEFAEEYGAEIDASTKLVGRKDGRDLLRTTHLVRLPPYARGDFVLVDDVPYKLLSFDRRQVLLLDLVRHSRIRRELHRLGSVRVIGRAEEQRDAVVVSRGPTHAQIMDPVSFKTVDVPSQDVGADAQSVPVFQWEESLYLVVASKRKASQ